MCWTGIRLKQTGALQRVESSDSWPTVASRMTAVTAQSPRLSPREDTYVTLFLLSLLVVKTAVNSVVKKKKSPKYK